LFHRKQRHTRWPVVSYGRDCITYAIRYYLASRIIQRCFREKEFGRGKVFALKSIKNTVGVIIRMKTDQTSNVRHLNLIANSTQTQHKLQTTRILLRHACPSSDIVV